MTRGQAPTLEGTSQGIGFGPYDLKPGDSVRIVLAEAVSGLSRGMCYKVGQNWKNQVYTDELPANSELLEHMLTNYHRTSNSHNYYTKILGFLREPILLWTFLRKQKKPLT